MIAEIIREHYDLGEVQIPEKLHAAHQRRHRKLVVETQKGRFLVKTYKNDPAILDTLRFQHRLSAHLAKNDLPVARIQEAKNGKRIVEIDNWAVELQQFIEGESMKVSEESLIISAKALGKFHEVCRDFPRPDRDTRLWRFSEVPRETFGRLYRLAKREGIEQEIDEYCNSIAFFLRDASEELHWDARSQFETGLIHGDWHSGNLLFKDGALVAILDLEFAGDGCYLEDLAYAVSNLCIRTTTEHPRLELRTNTLLDYYKLSRSLSPTEERALYYAVGVKHVTTVSYQSMQRNGLVAGHTPSSWMKRLHYQCQWLSERAKKVRWGG